MDVWLIDYALSKCFVFVQYSILRTHWYHVEKGDYYRCESSELLCFYVLCKWI